MLTVEQRLSIAKSYMKYFHTGSNKPIMGAREYLQGDVVLSTVASKRHYAKVVGK